MLIIDKEIEGKIVSIPWTKKQMTDMFMDAKNRGKVLDYANTVCVQADGEELDYILARFKNFPSCVSGSTMSWYGDMAKFIIGNWI